MSVSCIFSFIRLRQTYSRIIGLAGLIIWSSLIAAPSVVNAPNYRVVAGGGHNCALDDYGVSCWGDNSFLQSEVPANLLNARAVSTGFAHSCALDDAGVHCWGNNDFGQSSVPADLGDVRQLSAGGAHTCAVNVSGAVRCWGAVSADPAINYGQSMVPADLGSAGFVSAGAFHTCALANGRVRCWGKNVYGESNVPAGLSGVSQIAAGADHTCALDLNGVRCWGSNTSGQINVPVYLVTVRQLAAGGHHSCALDANGVRCWGNNTFGQSSAPVLSQARQISAGYAHACALDNSGVQCWGFVQGSAQTGLSFRNYVGDTDGDGVPDVNDLCPNSLVGAPVDTSGCALTVATLSPTPLSLSSSLPGSGDCVAGETAFSSPTNVCQFCHSVSASDGTLVSGTASPQPGALGYGYGKSEAQWINTLDRMALYVGSNSLSSSLIADMASYLATSVAGKCTGALATVASASPTPTPNPTPTPSTQVSANQVVTAANASTTDVSPGSCSAGEISLQSSSSLCGACHNVSSSDGTLIKGNSMPAASSPGYGVGKSFLDWVAVIDRMVLYTGSRVLNGATVNDLARYLTDSRGGACISP